MLSSSDSSELEKMLRDQGMKTQWETACQSVAKGISVPEEIYRVLGVQFSHEEQKNHSTPASIEREHLRNEAH